MHRVAMDCMQETLLFGPLAQLVEHRTFNPMVERSNRSRPTIQNKDLVIMPGLFCFCYVI